MTKNITPHMKQTLLTFAFIMVTIASYCQSASKEVMKYIESQEKGLLDPDLIKTLEKFPLSEILSACLPQLSDSASDIRGTTYQLLTSLALRKTEDPQISKIINTLIAGCSDNDAGIVYNNLNSLTQFPATAFDIEAKIKLSQLVKQGSRHLPILIKITGFVGISDLIYDYKELLRLNTYKDKKILWAINLSLARLGSEDHAGFCLNLVKRYPVTDDLVYELLPDLAFIRTKEAFDYMLNIILNDDKNCSSSNPDSEAKIICAYRVIKIVAPYIVNFPVKIDKGGDIITKNYEKTLIEAREWINTNINSYDLITQKY